eukprot:gb/GECG01014565.1/.p1 GENE.gb/GECG01014565.1/~~gb/GECG01014565.1/.p1  ORF type:complete len:452 (+),score=59.51 gb/GECG01014565.1/:1-1356(+)
MFADQLRDCETLPALTDDDSVFGGYTHVEFWHLVHVRAHPFSSGNFDALLKEPIYRWKKLLSSLSFKSPRERSSTESLLLAYHLCLQDRSKAARALIEKMNMPALSKAEDVLKKYNDDFPHLAKVYQWQNFVTVEREENPETQLHLFYDYMVGYLELQLVPPAGAYKMARQRGETMGREATNAELVQKVVYPLFPIATTVALAYEDFPDIRWRAKFEEMMQNLLELGEYYAVVDSTASVEETADAPVKTPTLHLEVDHEGTVKARAESCSSLVLKYYFLDVETLFSKEPFVFAAAQGTCKFGFAKPNYRATFRLPQDLEDTLQCRLPEPCKQQNSMIEGLCPDEGVRRTLTYCANTLRISVDETAGFVRVEDFQGAKAIPAVYIKVYWRGQGSTRTSADAKFYKDGYTDILGRFDFASLSTDELDKVEELAILVSSSSYGAEVVYAKPPRI